MTFEQRMAALGVDLSDLNVDIDRGNALYQKYFESAKQIAEEKGLWFNALLLVTLTIHDICERDDTIDRMETRIVNLTGERDYLLRMYGFDCKECKRYDECIGCDHDIVENWAGVPEDWSADD